MSNKDVEAALNAVEFLIEAARDMPGGIHSVLRGRPGDKLWNAWQHASAALPTLRALADQAHLTDADTERLVAHGEHLKDLEENR